MGKKDHFPPPSPRSADKKKPTESQCWRSMGQMAWFGSFGCSSLLRYLRVFRRKNQILCRARALGHDLTRLRVNDAALQTAVVEVHPFTCWSAAKEDIAAPVVAVAIAPRDVFRAPPKLRVVFARKDSVTHYYFTFTPSDRMAVNIASIWSIPSSTSRAISSFSASPLIGALAAPALL